MGNFSKLIYSRATSLIASVYFAAQGFSLSRGGMEQMKPVFFVLFCFVFLSCVCVFLVQTCELCKGKKTKKFPFLASVIHAFPFVFVSLV